MTGMKLNVYKNSVNNFFIKAELQSAALAARKIFHSFIKKKKTG
jgi:hypothetical protein